jgi:hypothetical protein
LTDQVDNKNQSENSEHNMLLCIGGILIAGLPILVRKLFTTVQFMSWFQSLQLSVYFKPCSNESGQSNEVKGISNVWFT